MNRSGNTLPLTRSLPIPSFMKSLMDWGQKMPFNGKGTVREALKENASELEEGKADVLGLYMITKLHQQGEVEGDLKEYYTTFMASIFRSVRFGASSAHGKANMIRFNYFQEQGAFTRDVGSGTYKIDYETHSSYELAERKDTCASRRWGL